jgi:serine/threonine protein kinase/ligand-binding sensor domain-containing protein
MNPYIGKTLGSYRLVEQIGQGGMATVFKAYQPSMDRYVAVKILPSHFTQDATFVARFTQEARVLARLEHPHILPVYDYGEQEGITYLVMRYVQAGTLHDWIAQQDALRLREIGRLMGQVGRALGYAHGQGVIHRDIKPSNVLIDPQNNAFLTDFGIAKIIAGTANYTGTGAVIGTPAYMAPEQGLGRPLDARCDIYALGVMLYEMVTGQVPFDAETPLAVMMKHVYDPLPLPRSLRPDVPEMIERIILKALAKLPEDRFQSAVQMVETLEQALEGLPTEIDLPPIPGGPTAVIPTPSPYWKRAHAPESTHPKAIIPTPTPFRLDESPASPAPEPMAELLSSPSPVRESAPEPVPAGERRAVPWLPVGGGVVGLIVLVVALLLLRTPPPDEAPFLMTPVATQPVLVDIAPLAEPADLEEMVDATPPVVPTGVPALFSMELTLDNRDAACAVEVGSWGECAGDDCGGIPYAGDFFHADPGCLNCRARCNFLIEKGGMYDVWVWWPRGEDRAIDTPHTLVYGNRRTTVAVNQRDHGNDWYPLALVPLEADTTFSIIVGGSETGFANLDGVRLTPATGWRNYVNHNSLSAVAVQGDDVWGGGPAGLVRWDPAHGSQELFTTAEGLPDNNVNALLVDDDDRLWAATSLGIAVFDDQTWTTFDRGDGLGMDGVTSLAGDTFGGVWAGLLRFDDIFAYYDGKTWTYAPDTPLPIPYARPLALVSDADWGLFAGLDRYGLAHFAEDTWRVYTQAQGLPADTVVALQLVDDVLYLAFEQGAARMDIESGVFTSLSPLSRAAIHAIYHAQDGRLWFGGDGIFAYDADDDALTPFTVNAHPFSSWPVRAIAEDDDALWFATEGGGLLRYDGDVWQHWTVPANLRDNRVNAVVQAADGALWFAHRAGMGLTRYTPERGAWEVFGEAEGALPDPGVPGVDSAGNLWIGGYGQLRWYDGSGWRSIKPAALDTVMAYGITFGPHDIMWVRGYATLLRYDPRTDAWTTFTAEDHPAIAKIDKVYAAPDGTCWIAGPDGLAYYDGSAWHTETLDEASSEVNALSGTPNGDIWAASRGDLFHRAAGKWERYAWPAGWVSGLQGAPDGTVWVWGDGLGHFNPADKRWKTSTTADGLVPGWISSVWITPEGVVWVGTDRGVSRYVP